MTQLKLIFKTITYYIKANILIALGVAISTAVLTGGLIIGDSVTFSLEQSAFLRLGMMTHVVTTVDRYFRADLAKELALKGGFDVAPALILDGMAVTEGGVERVNKVQITGVDTRFDKISKSKIYYDLGDNEAVISLNLAERLHLKKGDNFIVRIRKGSLVPLNAPFVSDAETSVSFRAVVKDIANAQNMGLFNLKNAQTAPYNLFLSLSRLNSLMKFNSKANRLLILAPSVNDKQITDLLNSCFTPEDAGLKVKVLPKLKETEISSERIFIDNQIIKAFESFGQSHAVLTYFTNSLEYAGKSTPYSFISTIDDNSLDNNGIIVNDWVASDLGVKVGDLLLVKYYEIGPLRQLVEKGTQFVVQKIVPIERKYGDRDLMPSLPGMSDAGHCRDWEAGVPISLGSIRPKDEAYWNKYKGTPKAFISLKKALQIWGNRFGNYTAIRINENVFTDSEYKTRFSDSVKPANLGILVTAVRENGLIAAHNGVDFSQLFLGLSFFLLVAALILTTLLFLLNLENRKSELGSLMMLGFTRNQIRRFFLSEGILISLTGGLLGLILAVIYTKLIFVALNTLWWSAVRTSVLVIDIRMPTLLTGLAISVLMSVLTIMLVLSRSFKRHAVELQRGQESEIRPIIKSAKKWGMILSVSVALALVGIQLAGSGNLSPSLFFISGALMLVGLLLLADYVLLRNRMKVVNEFSFDTLINRNRSQNLRRSLTVIILFALSTFLVISTGANTEGALSDANEQRSGTGGFQFFAETSVPVLFSLNDKEHLKKEGITTPFNAAQFGRIDGDDASCLNLNRASNPAILSADPALFRDRFSFDSKCPEIGNKEVWEALEEPFNRVIPAIADQTVIQWGLGKNVGDTLTYRNELGDTLRLKLIAGLSPSIFQGYVLISTNNFLKNFPTSSGSSLFLIDVKKESQIDAGDELKNVFRDYGWEMTTASERLNEFNSVANTYLSIFLALGALGLILGTVGLAVVLARTILERSKEIALLLALGFTKRRIVNLLVWEYAVLLIWGVLIGFLSAAVSVLPNFSTSGGKGSLYIVFLIVTTILLNGIIWIYALSWGGIRKRSSIINQFS